MNAPLASNQLDSTLLDLELHKLLVEKLDVAFLKYEFLSDLYKTYDVEVKALLRTLAFSATLGVCRPTPGMIMQGLTYPPELKRRPAARAALLLLTVVLPYVCEKVKREGAARGWRGLGGVSSASGDGGEDQDDEEDEEEAAQLEAAMYYVDFEDGREGGEEEALAAMRRRRASVRRRRLLYRAVLVGEKVCSLLQLLNFVAFLSTSMHPSLANRVVGVPLVTDPSSRISGVPPSHRPINYNFISKRLLFDGAMRFLASISPLSSSLRVSDLRNKVAAAFRWGRFGTTDVPPGVGVFEDGSEGSSAAAGSPASPSPGAVGAGAKATSSSKASGPPPSSGAPGRLASVRCGICYLPNIAVPYRTDCGHVFCYVCIRAASEGNDAWRCTVCGIICTKSRRLGGPKNYKS